MSYFYCACTQCNGHLCLEEDVDRLNNKYKNKCSMIEEGSSMSKYRPISDKVLIKIDTKEEKNTNGFYIPTSVNEDIRPGTVLAIGPGRWDRERVPMTVQVGDRVYIGKFSGVELGDKNHVVVREEEILAIEDAC